MDRKDADKGTNEPSREQVRDSAIEEEDARVAAKEGEQIADEDDATAQDAAEGRMP